MSYYKDLREFIEVLESNNKLIRISRKINKDTELMPLVRWQFRGLSEEQRKAFLFENVVDVKGKKYEFPVLVGAYAASTDIYALGMMCNRDEITDRWVKAQLHSIEPIIVESGPVHDNVYFREELIKWGGMGQIPVPISTPGFDNAPYLTNANWVTKDPDTGIRNVGNYRGMVKSDTRVGISCNMGQHLRAHWEKCKNKGIPLQAAIVIGASPSIGYTATTKQPFGVDEYAVAGGLCGEAVELVKCKTVDIEVPSTAEFVIEGELPVDYMEREAPFGEFTGYIGRESFSPYFNISCITHRNDAIYSGFMSQFPPSESSKIKSIGNSANWYRMLRYQLNNHNVLACAFHENGSGSAQAYLVIKIKKEHPSEVWHALNGANSYYTGWPRIIIAVDEDIDIWDPNSVNWALSFNMDPQRDVRIVQGKAFELDQAAAPPSASQEEKIYPSPNGNSAMLIDATRIWPYHPVSLPKKEYMERAMEIWEEEGLPKIEAKQPWHGYSLGDWSKENEEEAELALKGEHYLTGEKLAQQRIKV